MCNLQFGLFSSLFCVYRRLIIRTWILLVLSQSCVFPSSTFASIHADFHDVSDDAVLAKLELSSLPAIDVTQILNFFLTDIGRVRMGYGLESHLAPNNFVGFSPILTYPIYNDGIGGLGAGTEVDDSILDFGNIYEGGLLLFPGDMHQNAPSGYFITEIWGAPHKDLLIDLVKGIPGHPTIEGDWLISSSPVPEPSSIAVWAILAGAAGIARRRLARVPCFSLRASMGSHKPSTV